MRDADQLPGSWSDWITRLGQLEHKRIAGSATILREAKSFAHTCGISVEAATAQLLWLGSTAMLNHVAVQWPSGIWQPAGLVITAVEEDAVGIESITNALIDTAHRLGLDPIQDTVKEGPAGLIARLERKSDNWLDTIQPKESTNEEDAAEESGTPRSLETLTLLSQLATADSDSIAAISEHDIGNVRGLIYPSGRAFLSYLYDTPFFNTLDELIQHGNLNVRGKQDHHRLRHLNLSLFTAFYQGALANLLGDFRVQNGMSLLLRQMIVMWPTDGLPREAAQGRVSAALGALESVARDGLGYLAGLSGARLDAPAIAPRAYAPYIDPGVGMRFVSVNRYNRLIRIALAVAFWRIAAGDMRIEITDGDCAVADAILHAHDMSGRLLELAATRGKFGGEAMRLFMRLIDGESIAMESIAFASNSKAGEDTLNQLSALSVIGTDGKLADEFRYVDSGVMRAHAERWKL